MVINNKFARLEKFFRKFPKINLGNWVLDEMSGKYAEDYLALYQDEESLKFLSDEGLPATIDDAMREIRYYSSLFYHKSGVHWGIFDCAKKQLIGQIHFNYWNVYSDRADLSYHLLSRYSNQGIMSRALYGIMPTVFSKMCIHRLEAKTMEDNVVSQHLLKKLGFKYEGKLRDYRMIRGQYESINMYSLLSSECCLPIREDD